MNPLGGVPLFVLVIVLSAAWKEVLSASTVKFNKEKIAIDRTAGSSASRSRYETLEEILPLVSFKCKNRAPGYYADPRFECEVFHFCHPDGSRVTIPCPRTEDHRPRHRICNLRDGVTKGCGQNEIYLKLPEDLANTKDTTSSNFHSPTEFKFQTVLPQPSLPVEVHEPTTPLSSYEEVLKFYPNGEVVDDSKILKIITEEATVQNDNPFFIEKPEIFQPSPPSFRRGLKQKPSNLKPVSIQSPESNSGVQFLKTVYVKNVNENKESNQREVNPSFIADPNSSDIEDEKAILYLLEIFNKSLNHFDDIDNSPYEKKSKTKRKLINTNMIMKKNLPGLHPRRRKRMVIQEINTARPYAIFYAKLPETSRRSVDSKPLIQLPTARVPDKSKQTVELTFDPSAIPKNLPTVPIAIRVPKKSRSKKKKPRPQVIYENPSEVPQEDFENPQVSEQRNFYYYYPQQVVANPYLSTPRQNVPSYVITSDENQRPQLDPQQRNPQNGPNNFPEGGSPPRQRNVPPVSNTPHQNLPSDSQGLRGEEQKPQHLPPERSPPQFQSPPSSGPQTSPGLLSPYGSPEFMNNLPPPYENLPTYQNGPAQPQQRPRQQPRPHQPPQSSPVAIPPSQGQLIQNRPQQPSQAPPPPPQISNEHRQNRPNNNNNNQNGNFPSSRTGAPTSDTPTNQESAFGFFPSSFQSPFFQGFPPLPDFGNPFLPQPPINRPQQFGEQFSPPPSNSQPPQQQFQGGPNTPPPQQSYPVVSPQEFSEPQGRPSPPIREEPGQREPQAFVENNGNVTPLSSDRKRPNRRPKRPRPQGPSSSPTINDNGRSRNQDRPSRQRGTRPSQYDEEVNVVVPSIRTQRQRPEHPASPPRQSPREIVPPQFSNDANIIPPNRPSRPDSEHFSIPHADRPNTISSHDQGFGRPDSINQFSPLPDSYSPPTERRPQGSTPTERRPQGSPQNVDDSQFFILQNGQRLSGPGIGGEERHYYIPETNERPSRPSSNDNRPSHGSQNRQRPPRPVEESNQLSYRPHNDQRPPRPPTESNQRPYRPQSESGYLRNTDEDRLPQRHQTNTRPNPTVDEEHRQSRRPQSNRRPSGSSIDQKDQSSYRTQNTRRPSRPSSNDEDQHSYRTQNTRRPSTTEDDQRSYRTQSSRRPPRPSLDDEDQRSHVSQSNRRPSESPFLEEDRRSHRTQDTRRPSGSPYLEEDQRSYSRPQNSQRQGSSSGNSRSRRPLETERPTTLPPRLIHTTQVYVPRDQQSNRRPSVTIDQYRNYYPPTTVVPRPSPFAYTVPQAPPTRPSYGAGLTDNYEPSSESHGVPGRQVEKSRTYVTSPENPGISNLVQTERYRPFTNDRPSSYIDYIDSSSGRPISENQVNVLSGGDGYDSRTQLPPRSESYQSYDNSRERGRTRYTTSSPITDTRFQSGQNEDASHVTYSQPRDNRHNSNSIGNGDRRNRYTDRSRTSKEEESTTSLPRTTRKPKPIPPRPTFPSFPTFPPPPKRRSTTTERPIETIATTQPSYVFTDDTTATSQPKRRLNSRPRATTSLPVIIGTSTSVHRQGDDRYEIDVEATTLRPPQKKRPRKRTRPRHRRPRPTTTTMVSLEYTDSLPLEERREEIVSQPPRKNYKRRGYAKSTTTAVPSTSFSARSEEPESSEEYGSRIKLFKPRTRKTTLKYTPRIPSTTSRPVSPEASEPRKTIQDSADSTSTRKRRPYRKRTRTRTTTSTPYFDDSTDLNIARSDENVETLKYQDVPSAPSTVYLDEATTFYASTEPYHEFISDEETESLQEVIEKSTIAPEEQNFNFETTKTPANRPRLWSFGKPKLSTN